MNGLIALLGSGEYLPVMDAVDRYLLDSRQRTAHEPNVVCLPTAAGEEGDDSVNYWLDLGVAHFQRFGVPSHRHASSTAPAPTTLPGFPH